jgi:hypothetical protein
MHVFFFLSETMTYSRFRREQKMMEKSRKARIHTETAASHIQRTPLSPQNENRSSSVVMENAFVCSMFCNTSRIVSPRSTLTSSKQSLRRMFAVRRFVSGPSSARWAKSVMPIRKATFVLDPVRHRSPIPERELAGDQHWFTIIGGGVMAFGGLWWMTGLEAENEKQDEDLLKRDAGAPAKKSLADKLRAF